MHFISREAIWEGRYKDNIMALRYRHSICDADVCLNKSGREFRAKSGKWILKLCKVCAAFGQHVGCIRSRSSSLVHEDYVCPLCLATLSKRLPKDVSLADQTLFENEHQMLTACEMESDDPDIDSSIEVITISSHHSINPSEAFTWTRKRRTSIGGLSPDSQRMADFLKYLDHDKTSVDRRRYRLRLLLGNRVQLHRAIKM